jgi:hypothetical protein
LPGAHRRRRERIIAALSEAVDAAVMPDGVEAVRASFAWAVWPLDAVDPVPSRLTHSGHQCAPRV